MTDEQLAERFAEGTAPERDAAFAYRVDARIGHARLGHRLPTFAIHALVFLTVAAALFATVRALDPMLRPTLEQIAESSPHFMGVPLPLVLGVLVVGLAVRFRRFAGRRLG